MAERIRALCDSDRGLRFVARPEDDPTVRQPDTSPWPGRRSGGSPRSTLTPGRSAPFPGSAGSDVAVAAATEVKCIEDIASLETYRDAWDTLAIRAGRPYSLSPWGLIWWRNARPRNALLRAIVVLEGGRLVGIAPLYANRTKYGFYSYRFLGGSDGTRVDMVAAPGCERSVASAIVDALSEVRPRAAVINLNGIETSASELYTEWRKHGFRRQTRLSSGAPYIDCMPDPEAWLTNRGSHFRQQIRRRRRYLASDGGQLRVIDDGHELETGVRECLRLHRSIWDRKGGSKVVTPAIEATLVELANDLAGSGHLRLAVAEGNGETIASVIVLAAGGEAACWLSGYDARWGRITPTALAMLEAARDAHERGDRRLELGAGLQAYKDRLSDGQRALRWLSLIPPGGLGHLAAATSMPTIARAATLAAVARKLPLEKRASIRLIAQRWHLL